MKLGQRAMIAAKVNSLQNKEFGNQKKVADEIGVTAGYVSKASLVLLYAIDQVDGVISGTSRAQ